MITIPIEPYWDKLMAHYKDQKIDLEFWEWIKRDYGGYQVYVVSNPSSTGEKEGCGLFFGEESEATFFALKWS